MKKDLTKRAQTPSRERRAISDRIELREAGGGSGFDFSGYAAIFDVPYTVYDWLGSFQETVVAGAYTKTLAENADVRLLINHDGVPLARTKSATLALEEDDTGLHATAPGLDPANPTVQEVKSALDRKDIDQMSHSFRVIRQEWNGDYSERFIKEAELYDVSIVTFPASPTTSASLRTRELLDVLQDLEGVPAEQLLAGMRSSRKLPTPGSLRSLRSTIDHLLVSRADADEDPGALAQAVDAAIDAVVEAFASGNTDQAQDLLTAAEVAVDALLEAMGLSDPDDLDAGQTSSKLQKSIASQTGSSIALLRRQLDLIEAS